MVIGYGTKLKKDITGSVVSVSAKEISNTPSTSFESAIQGRASGVLVSQQNGKLGQGINIRIRGASSILASNEPLYVVDGLPISADDQSSTSAPTNALADINMNDIESVEILKDASATAIFGSRGANGVVLITTKKGKAGKSKIDVNYFTGNQKPTRKMSFLNAKQYVDFFTQAAKGAANQDFLAGYFSTAADAQSYYTSYVDKRFTRYAAGNSNSWQNNLVNTDWQDQVLRTAPISQYDLNLSGGNDKTKYYISGQYLDQQGILIGNSYNRYSGRFNLDQKANDWLNVGFNMNVSRSVNNRVANDDAFSTPLQIIALAPITPTIDPRTGLISGALDTTTGSPNSNFPTYYNPMLSVANAYYKTTVNRTFGNVYGNAVITKALSFKTEFGMDQLNQLEESFDGRLTARNTSVPNGQESYNTTQELNTNINSYFNFKQTFKEKHEVEMVLGMSFENWNTDYGNTTAQGFPSDAWKNLNAGATKSTATSGGTSHSLLSYFFRGNYQYDDKYLFAVSGRIDGSSRFGANNKYGFFPAASAGWILSKEKFLQDANWLSFLKVKASYGVNGNDGSNNFGSKGLYTTASYGGDPGQVPYQIANPDLKWETTLGSDFGIEASIFKNRLSFEFDYYNRDTRDLLLNVSIPGTSGFGSVVKNLGKLNNKGIEFSINSTNVQTKDFQWTSSFNIAANKNVIISLNGQLLGGDVNKAKEGQPLGVFYAREFAGADPANGDALYVKNSVKTDGTLDKTTTNDYNAATDVRIGNPNPKFIYGFGNTFTYKYFDLDLLIQGVSGNNVYLGGGQYMSASGSNGFDNQTTDQLAAWKNPGDKTNVPEARLFYGNGVNNSSRYISDGSYLRVKALTFGFNVPQSITRKIKIEKIKLYLRGQNLFTITKYKGWDPEVNTDYLQNSSSPQTANITQGVDFYSAPQAKTFVFGANISL